MHHSFDDSTLDGGTTRARRRPEQRGGSVRPAAGALAWRLALAAPLILTALSGTGCAAAALAGALADSYERTGSTLKYAEYEGLMGETVAVIVNTDMSIRMNEPTIDGDLQLMLTARLQSPPDAEGAYTGVNPGVDPETGEALPAGVRFVPYPVVRQFQLRNPSWAAWPFEEVAGALGATRLVIVDVYEYRFHEPGNAHLWDGQMSARVSVIEAGDGFVDDYAFEREIRVRFPNEEGVTRNDLSQQVVRGRLVGRFIDRVGWLFYDHKEPNMIEY